MVYLKQKDGFIEKIDLEEFNKLSNNYFRCYDRNWEYSFINIDSKNFIPYMKDILNRKHKFIEIKYLKIILVFCVINLFFWVFFVYINNKIDTSINDNFKNIKNDINRINLQSINNIWDVNNDNKIKDLLNNKK